MGIRKRLNWLLLFFLLLLKVPTICEAQGSTSATTSSASSTQSTTTAKTTDSTSTTSPSATTASSTASTASTPASTATSTASTPSTATTPTGTATSTASTASTAKTPTGTATSIASSSTAASTNTGTSATTSLAATNSTSSNAAAAASTGGLPYWAIILIALAAAIGAVLGLIGLFKVLCLFNVGDFLSVGSTTNVLPSTASDFPCSTTYHSNDSFCNNNPETMRFHSHPCTDPQPPRCSPSYPSHHGHHGRDPNSSHCNNPC